MEPVAWDEVVSAYGTDAGLLDVLPAAASQALLSFADTPVDSAGAVAWYAGSKRSSSTCLIGHAIRLVLRVVV